MNAQKTVLVVEDEAPMRKAIVEKLTHAGFSTLEAVDGEEGLDVALSKHPDLILLDIYMPKMIGTEMFQELQKSEWGRSVPVIILTNLHADDELIQHLSRLNLVEYLVKTGTRLEYVIERIQKVLGTDSS